MKTPHFLSKGHEKHQKYQFAHVEFNGKAFYCTRFLITSLDLQMEMKVLLCKFLQAFSYTLDAEQSFDVEDHNTLRPKGGTRLTLTPRDPLHR